MRRLFPISSSPFETAKTLKDRGKFLNDRKEIIGKVPGVEVGDVFQYWNELNIIGLHREMKYEKYIDHVIRDRKRIATSVVCNGLDDDGLEHYEVYISTEIRENAELLVNSFNVKNDIRVIIKCFLKNSGRCGMDVYCYYGLYKEEVAWNVLMKYGIDGIRKGLIVEDISRQREAVPICVINTVDKERLTVESFVYKTKMIYPNWCKPIPVPHLGCDCEGKCGDSAKCLCAVRNGGKIPYNKNNVIVASGGVIHECGPYCKCSADCPNRVSQKGIKFNLEISRTERKGWGVRSRATIPAGSFICEYIGEVIEDDEVDKRVDNDEYLFSIGDYHMDDSVLKEAYAVLCWMATRMLRRRTVIVVP
ncbi:histone-lysine N-methyltransferase, H3 lysine-9 specific SUVH5-like [Cicer arietinum]|uniref:Histone-lysine N-methyltransferase, H3 lysine-9 specific SUVH5-like n=1 Tax=Cicer arietinum TaxID=3827 RepID=A0A1S3DWE6_CICAR|nr:histone-lysine N-methyltransferase, H3 lysine-9 specific SUVH5-like [Cicer arietinum]